jgi:predicted NBD/HSP70 family sugar kinase
LDEMPVIRDKDRRGRPSILLTVKATHAYFVGVSITETPPLMVLVDMCGNVVGQREIAAHTEPKEVAASIQRGMGFILSSKDISIQQVLGIGIALSGFVDHNKGICIYSAAKNWNNVPITDIVNRATGIPAYIDNDANAIAIGEKLFGIAREFANFSILTLGRNIGCAHYINGRLYRGHNGGAGEIGHITIAANGPPCPCGKRGCLDVIAASMAIISAAKGQNLPVEMVRDVEALAMNGSAPAIAILREAGQALGLAVANIIQINNPAVVLFADIVGFGNGIFSTATLQTAENNILPRLLSSTRLLFHPVEQSFMARGAASIAAHQYLLVCAGAQ